MPTRHVSEKMLACKIEGGLQLGQDRTVLVDADLSSLAAAKTAVDADVAKLHVSERLIGVKVKSALDRADEFVSGYTTGTTAANSANIVTGSTIRGCAPVL